MTVSTLRPNSTLENTSNVTGAASAHAALADDSDGSYLTFDPGEYLIATFDDLALPSGALIKRSQLRARVAKQSANGNLTSFLQMATFSANDAAWVSWLSPTQITVGEIDATGIADSDVDAAAFGLAWSLSSGTCRAYEAYLDVTLVERPEVTAVTAPTGTVADTNRPTVAWTRDLDADGGPQTAYQVRVFTDAQYGAGGFDPATSTPFASTQGGFSGANDASVSWQVDTILPDDTYRAYVRIAQRVNGAYHWSDWEYSEFEVDVALPDPPTINVSDDPANARITITITPGIGGATSDAFLLERTYDGGATWLPVRQLDAGLLPVGDPATIVYDYEAPLGVDVSYRAAALHDYSGVHAYSAFDTGSENLEDVADWWLKHPNQPALNTPVDVRGLPEIAQDARQGVFQALGASMPVVVSDSPGPKTGTVTFRCMSHDAQAAIDALLAANATLLLQSPLGHGGPGYIRFGSRRRRRIFEQVADASRVWDEITFVVVDSPPGDVDAWP